MLQDVLWGTLSKVEPILLRSPLRKWANREALKQVVYEDENKRYVDIGPVNKVFNCLCRYFSGDAEGVEKHMPRFWDYLWVAEDGMKMQGYNGSQIWDCAFAVQAIEAPGLASTSVCATPLSISTTVKLRRRAGTEEILPTHLQRRWPFSTGTTDGPFRLLQRRFKSGAILMDMEDQGLIKLPKKQNSSRSISGLRKCNSELSKHARFGFKPKEAADGRRTKHSSR